LQFRTIEFKDVHFGYGEDTPVLHGIDFRAEHNRKVAFVGQSGGGKSTIFAFIERYYDVLSGAIEIDCMDIRSIPLGSLRKNIGYLDQESSIISGTKLENITYGLEDSDYTHEEVESAVVKADAKEFIDALEDGLDTEVGERGV